jgi:pantoate--beta-alanine ligase
METIDSVSQMRTAASRLRSGKGVISLIPTMGALHPGHEALITAAKAAGGAVVVSIFVNPLAFGSNENLAGYPRSLEADIALCEKLGVDAVFAPQVPEIFPKGYSTFVTEEAVSKPLCGLSRPTHFRGVATLITKLLNIVGPDRIVLGQKDVQHVAVVRKVAGDLNYGVEILVVPTVREFDGLAVSVRNRDLTATQRHESLAINRALAKAKEMVESGVRSTDRLVAEVTHILGKHNRLRVIYASVVDPVTMESIREVEPGKALLCIAAWVDETRLTDNVVL